MKKIVSLLVLAASIVSLEAQITYVPVNYIKMDHITLNGGTCMSFNTPAFKLSEQVEPTSTNKTPGMFVQFNTYSSHSDMNDLIASGLDVNIFFLKNQWDVSFSNEVMKDPNYNYHFMGKFNEFGANIGEIFTFRFSDNVEMVAAIGLGVGAIICGDVKTEAVHVKNDMVYPDPTLNEWHTAKANDNFSFELGLYAKLGGYYRLNDWFSVGLLGMYNLPLLGTALVNIDSSASASYAHNLGYEMKGFIGKLQFGSLMFSIRFDID